MNRINRYTFICLLLVIPVLFSCTFGGKKANRRISLWRKDKIPYGTYYAYENLHYIFPGSEITVTKSSPVSYTTPVIGMQQSNHQRKYTRANIIISPQVIPDESEITALINFVGEGNHVFISSFLFGDSLLKRLKMKAAHLDNKDFYKDSLNLSIYDPVSHDSLSFSYPGTSADNYVDSLDSEYTSVLGRDAAGHPNFVRFTYKGGGSLSLHFAPMAFTNYFLLHKNNKAYYDLALSYLPKSIDEVRWDDYFRYADKTSFSSFQYILSNKALQWAFWLLLLLFGFVYVFESKRKQRIIPVIAPLRNSSLEFVKTIGRLYYQRRDNSNLASKMSIHFMDYVRTKYNLPTSLPDEDLVNRLAFKSGFDKQQLRDILAFIKAVSDGASPRDEEMMAFSKTTEEFYKYA